MTDETPHNAQDIYNALGTLREEPYGPARSARTEALVEAAELLGLDEPLATALLSLVDAYEYGAEPRKQPLAFARALKLHDAHPEAFDEREAHSLYWRFKWITSALIGVPEVPLDSIRGWLDQQRERYASAELGLHAVHAGRFALAEHSGLDLDFAYENWATRPRDRYSDCEACEARLRGRYRARRGDDERAVAEWQPVLDGSIGCSVEPAATMAEALLPLARLGRGEQAASHHRAGYRAIRGKVGMAAQLGLHLEFAARTGNAPRGLEVLAENRGRFDDCAAPLARLEFLTGVRILMGELVARDAGAVIVPGPAGSTHTAASLLEEATKSTDELAAAFDARNGTSWISGLLRARCEQAPLTDQPLALGVRSAMPGVAAIPAAKPRPAAVPADFETLLAEARAAALLARPDAERLWRAVVERLGGDAPDDLLRAELAIHAAGEASDRKDWDAAVGHYAQARALMAAAGEPGREAATWARMLWCESQRDEQAVALWSELDAVLAVADALLSDQRITADRYCLVLHCRVAVAADPVLRPAEGRPAPTDRDVERLEREIAAMKTASSRLGALHRSAAASGVLANALAVQGRVDEAIDAIAETVRLVESSDRPWMLPDALAQHGLLLHRTGDQEQAKTLLHRALAVAVQWPDSDFDQINALWLLAEACRSSGDHAAAARHFADVAARQDQAGNAEAASVARAALGQSLLLTGHVTDAVAVLESLVNDEGERAMHDQLRAQARLDLGRGLLRLGEPRAAAETFLWLADFTEPLDDDRIRVMVGGELAEALAAARLWAQMREAVDRTLASDAAADQPAAVCHMLRKCANALITDGDAARVGEALEYLHRCDEINVGVEESETYRRWLETAPNALLRAQGLAQIDRNDDALAAIEVSIAAWREGGDSVLAELAEATRVAGVIEGFRLGRKAQARARVLPIAARCRDAGLTQQAQQLTRLEQSLREDGQS